MGFLYLKALHIIFVVTWFAGLFYVVRIFIYLTEAAERPEEERRILIPEYKRNMKRLWLGITWPSAILTFILGFLTLYQVPDYLKMGFMQVKLALVVMLYIYHFYCHSLYKNLLKDSLKLTSQQLRIFNEVATLFLVAIIFVIVLKNALNMLWGVIGMFIFALCLMVAIKIYKNFRDANN